MRKHFTNCSFRKNLLNGLVISKQDSSLQVQHYFITSYVCSMRHCRTEEKWGWIYRVSPVIFIITAATSSLASFWALVAWLLTSFLPEIAPCPPRQYPQFRDRHKNCNLKSKFRCKVFKIGLFKWGLEEFLLKVEHKIWKLDWDFLLTRIILRRRGLKIANLSALEEMTKDVRCREEWDF